MFVTLTRSFNVTSKRNKIKKLPLGEHEVMDVNNFSLPKTVRRRFHIKSIFLGVMV